MIFIGRLGGINREVVGFNNCVSGGLDEADAKRFKSVCKGPLLNIILTKEMPASKTAVFSGGGGGGLSPLLKCARID